VTTNDKLLSASVLQASAIEGMNSFPSISRANSKSFDSRVAYVLTHYPRVALTFISGEIDEVERAGMAVLPIVMNRPTAGELVTAEARDRERQSIYLKALPTGIVAAAAVACLRHPIGMAALALRVSRSAGLDVGLIIRRIIHLAYAAFVARHCEKHQVRHLHAHFGQTPATIAWLASEIMNLSSNGRGSFSFTIHGFHDFVDESVARLDLKARAADFVVCISDFTKSQLCRITPPSLWDRFHVIRCGIDLDRFSLRTAGPRHVRPRIAMVGRLSPEKGHLVVLRAIALLTLEGVNVDLEIIGGGPFKGTIAEEARRLNLEENIRFSGELEPHDLAARLAEADVFCMASFAEGLPVSIMEAMALGVPVVSTWISGIPELARNEVTALLVPPGNAEELASALKRLIQDGGLRERLARAGRDAVVRDYVRRENALKLVELLRPSVDAKLRRIQE
jgi:glycosyltransferase involved in cell wall biosynthesis